MKTHKDRTLPVNGEIWVFGSNTRGAHGAGAARVAYQTFGAVYGVGFGMTGNSYAIPTKDHYINTLSIAVIKDHIDEFVRYVKSTPDTEYFLTAVGCGLAACDPATIAPLFAPPLNNVSYPEQWVEYLN